MRTKLCREEKVNEQTDKKADTAETEEKEGRQKCVFACVYSDFFRNTDFSSADSEIGRAHV